jgi:hypothetical protein
MTDRITANLPARDMDETAAFYQAFGFAVGFKDDGWMILTRGALELEFFPHSDLNPRESCFSACIRVDDLDALYAGFAKAGLPTDCWSMPRISEPKVEPFGLRMFALIDPNGSLLRCIDNKFKP